MTDTPRADAPDAPDAPDATTELVRSHLRPVWRYLRMHGASPHEADDLTQEAFVVALQRGALQLPPAAVATFLRRTARFVFLHHVRDRRSAIELADAVDERWQRDCEDDDGQWLLTSLRQCVDKLDGRARRAVELAYGFDRGVGTVQAADRDAVATELGLQPNGLKTLLQRLRQQLRACIERNRP